MTQEFSSLERARSWDFRQNQASSSFLINSSNIKMPPEAQREISQPRIWPLDCTSPGDCSSGCESWKQGSHILLCERCLFFLLLQVWSSEPCLPPRLPATETARWTPVSRNQAHSPICYPVASLAAISWKHEQRAARTETLPDADSYFLYERPMFCKAWECTVLIWLPLHSLN